MAILIENKLGVQLTGKEMKEIKKMVTVYKIRNIVPILQNVEFKVENNRLSVTIKHNKYEITRHFKTTVEGEGNFLVPLSVIKNLKGIKNDDIFSLSITENNKLELFNNGSKRVFIIDSIENYPKSDDKGFKYISEANYNDILKLNDALISVAKSEIRPILQCVLIRDNHIYSTDSHRMYGNDTTISYDKDIILNNEGVKRLKTVFNKNEVINVYLNDNYAKFENENGNVMIRLKEGNYPEVKRLIPDHSTTSFIINDKKAFMDIIKDAATVSANERNNVIKFNITKDELIVMSKNEEVGEFEASTPIHNMEGEELTLMMSGRYMTEGLKQVHSDSIELKFNGHMRPFTINSTEKEKEFALILPVRLY